MMGNVMRLGINVVPESGSFEADEVLQLFDAWPRTTMFAAPTMVKRLVECPAQSNPENIRTIVWGGAPMYVADALAAIERFGPRFAQIYGQGESPMTITALSKQDIAGRDHPRWAERLGSAGRPFAGVEVLVADTDDRALPAGESGEILCRGDVVMPGYWANPDATAATLRGGWLHTGDVGAFDAEGYLTLKDRSKDVIISGGSNIDPREVEEILLEHAGVREVVGDRTARCRMGRSRCRLRCRRSRTRRTRCALPERYRALQATQGLLLSSSAAEEQLRQNSQDRAAR